MSATALLETDASLRLFEVQDWSELYTQLPPEAVPEQNLPMEQYGASLASLRSLGNIAVARGIEVEQVIEAPIEARDDFVTALGENLSTDKEYGDYLYFRPIKKFDVVDGRTVDGEGRAIIQIIQNGVEASRAAAKTDKNMQVQFIRDEGDLLVGSAVDNLLPGELLSVVSFDPKIQLKENKKYWEDMGYREGMAVLQTYYKATDNKVLAWAHAIKNSDPLVVATVQNELGMNMDSKTDYNLWIRQMHKESCSMEYAKGFADNFLTRIAQLSGDQTKRVSVTGFIEEQADVVDRHFSTYMVPLAIAVATGRNNDVLRSFALSLQKKLAQKTSKYDPSIVSDIYNSDELDSAQLIFLEDKIRYALVEELRLKIPKFIASQVKPTDNVYQDSSLYLEHRPVNITPFAQIDYHQLQLHHNYAVAGILRGSESQRTYGGCSSSSGVKIEKDNFEIDGLPQDIFGGKSESIDSMEASDDKGPLSFKCPKGCDNTRERNEIVSNCKKCDIYVGCGMVPDKNKTNKQEKNKSLRGAKKSATFLSRLFKRSRE